ncbi:MAG TPA: efflux RND transporter periplasmic adaptor subunit, partial [Methylophilaceae bacterium]|nr:efflux RND transporter periplasmic adaptor subunit [Methylophilaceae bacterium]
GIVLAFLILRSDKPQPASPDHEAPAMADTANLPQDTHEHPAPPPEFPRGPHGGKLFTQDGYSVEVTIFEENTPPQFRLYTYQDKTPLAPSASTISMQIERLGRAPQPITLVPEADYLKSQQVIGEPHSFKVAITAKHGGKNYQFNYEQVEARAHMTGRQVELNGIEILTAGPARIKSTLNLMGEIRVNADRSVFVVPRLSGLVEAVPVNAGDKVKKGQVLAVISSQSLADQRSELMAAQKRLALARTTYEREKKLWEDKISAEQDYLQARQAMQEAEIAVQSARQKLTAIGGNAGNGSTLTRYEVRSPIDGVVTDKQVAVGQVVGENSTIFMVADLSSVWAELTVYAKDLPTIRTGQQVTVKATAFDAEATGTVSYIGSLVGEQARTTTARVVLPNPEGLWRPGLPVNVEVVSEETSVPLAVAEEGLQTLNDKTVVFARYGENFEARPLKLGRRDGRYAEVLEGLLPGEKYAAKNSFLVKAELGKASASHDH